MVINTKILHKKIGKSRSYVANAMRLLNLPILVQEYVINGVLTMGQVRPLLTLNEEDALNIAHKTIDQGLSSRQVENLCNLLKGRKLRTTKKIKILIMIMLVPLSIKN